MWDCWGTPETPHQWRPFQLHLPLSNIPLFSHSFWDGVIIFSAGLRMNEDVWLAKNKVGEFSHQIRVCVLLPVQISLVKAWMLIHWTADWWTVSNDKVKIAHVWWGIGVHMAEQPSFSKHYLVSCSLCCAYQTKHLLICQNVKAERYSDTSLFFNKWLSLTFNKQNVSETVELTLELTQYSHILYIMKSFTWPAAWR